MKQKPAWLYVVTLVDWEASSEAARHWTTKTVQRQAGFRNCHMILQKSTPSFYFLQNTITAKKHATMCQKGWTDIRSKWLDCC